MCFIVYQSTAEVLSCRSHWSNVGIVVKDYGGIWQQCLELGNANSVAIRQVKLG